MSPFYLLIVSLSAAMLPPTESLITLGIGQQLLLERETYHQVSIARPDVALARFTPDERQILITAVQPGNTDLTVWTGQNQKLTYPLRVIGGETRDHARELAELLKSLPQIRVRLAGNHILIEGEALRPQDVKTVTQIAQAYPNVTNLVELDPSVGPLLMEEINGELKAAGLIGLQTKRVGSEIYLTGDALNEASHHRALTLAHAYYPAIRDLTQISGDAHPSIRIDLTLIEMSKSRLFSFGIRWQEMITASAQIHLSSAGSQFGILSNPSAIFDLIEKKGLGRILTQPSLACRSGGEAKFHAGGEIPIRLVSERTAEIIFKPYGILLNISPRLTAQRNVSLTIETEVSTLDGGNSIDGIPAFLTRKVATQATIKPATALVLAGLTDQNDLKNTSRIPFLAGIPGLGEIFKSRNLRHGDTELFIFIQPHLVESEQDHLAIDRHRKTYTEKQRGLKPQWTD